MLQKYFKLDIIISKFLGGAKMTKANKERTTKSILKLISGYTRPCTKLKLDNIIFPSWDKLGLLGMIYSQKVKTHEQPKGCDYAETKYQVVMRVINGQVLKEEGNRPDAYTWSIEKVMKSKNARFIGTNSAEGIINLANMLNSIKNEYEKHLFAEMFCKFREDLLLITSQEEKRTCVEVTEELYDKGLTYCIDEWMETDENGDSDITLLDIGDFLIITKDGVYTIQRNIFLETHSLD